MYLARLLKTWSFRLTLLYAALFGVSVLILFGVTYWSAADYAALDESNENAVEFRAIVDEAALAGYDRLPTIIADHLSQRAGTRAAYLLEDKDGNKIAGNIDALPPQEGAMKVHLWQGGESHKLSAHGYRLPNDDYLVIGQDSLALKEMKELIARAFGVGAATTLLLAIAGGVIISRSMLRRVESVSRTTRAIVAGNLSQRVPLRGSDDEFDHLAASVNAMLDRIEDLMQSMRQVSNDVAHDLRTPLTRLRQRLELARRHNQSADELREALDVATGQVDAILETFGALLRIAQVEAGQGLAAETEIDLSELLGDIAEDFTPSAEDRSQTIATRIPDRLTLRGDRRLLTQMVVNLVENAIRHSPPGAHISLEASENRGGVAIRVSDNGPGIRASEREKVLRPFYRLETSRTTEGSGLGLSLVAAIAKHYRAALTLADNAPGLLVTVQFPRVAGGPDIGEM